MAGANNSRNNNNMKREKQPQHRKEREEPALVEQEPNWVGQEDPFE